jgi:acyl-CoA synthetase (AMP-forming)/AMP-acid ligase II
MTPLASASHRPHPTVPLVPFRATMPAMLGRIWAERAGQECIVADGARLTFAEVAQASARLALGLRKSGVGKGSRVGILMPNSAEWIVAFAAVTRMGAIAVGISTFLKAEELHYVVRHADIDTLLIANEMLGHNYLDRLEEGLRSLAGASPDALELPEAPFLRRIWTTGPNTRPWLSGTLENLQELGAQVHSPGTLLSEMEDGVSPADDALMIYTSGSTAAPKAVVHTHDTVTRHSFAVSEVVYVKEGDRICAAMPFFWVGGLLATMLPAFHNGATLVCPKSQNPQELVALLRAEQITHLSGWGNVLASIADQSREAADVLQQLKPMTDAQRLFFLREPREQIPNQLGMTETFGHHSSERPNSTLPPGREGAFGRAMPGVERKIIEPSTGSGLRSGEVGELCIRGYSVMAGLYKVERWKTFDADGWYHTGDKCHIDDEGYLFFHGRYGEMIKTSGANVAPPEVEAVIRAFEEVVDVAVFGTPDPIVGETVCAVVVLKAGESLTVEELKARLRQRLSSFKVPKRIEFMEFEQIPRTESGKVRKHILSATFATKMS